MQYAKVAEYQVRGAVHFHALVRLDGPRTPDGFAPAPPAVDATRLADLVRAAAASVRLTVPGVDASDPARLLAFGRQLDARPVRSNRRTDDPDRTLSPEQVAGYLAKYATKSVTDTGATDNAHHRRLRATARDLACRADAAHQDSYELLGKWTHMLGFRGHFASKSRRYSVTLGALRRARRRAQALIAQSRAEGRPLDLAALEADLLAERRHRDHPGHRQLALRRLRMEHRSRTRARHRRGRPSPRVRPVASRTEEPTKNFGRWDKVMDEKLLYRIGEVAHYLSLSRSKTYELVRAGHIPSVRIDGVRRVRGADVVAYVESLRAA